MKPLEMAYLKEHLNLDFEKGNYVLMAVTVEVPDLESLSAALTRLQQIPNVYSVHRAEQF